MADNKGQRRCVGEGTRGDLQICSTDAYSMDFYQHLALTYLWLGDLHHLDRLIVSTKYCGSHSVILSLATPS
jgi:hypothetical protein